MKPVYKKGEVVPCVIESFDLESRNYTVTTISDHLTGLLHLYNHPVITPILRDAMRTHKIIDLHFSCVYNGQYMFKYILEDDNSQEQSLLQSLMADDENTYEDENNESAPIEEKEVLSIPLSSSNNEYNTQLLNSLFAALGEKIDNDEKFELASNIIAANRKHRVSNTLNRDIYNKANSQYQMKFWTDGVLPYCSNIIVSKAWKKADEEEKQRILQRLGIKLSNETASANDMTKLSQNQTNAPIDNSSRTTQEIESEATSQAISERQKRQTALNSQRINLHSQSEDLNVRHASVKRQQQEHATQTVQLMSQAHSETERERIQRESHQEESRIREELHTIESQQQHVQEQISNVSHEIQHAQEEIKTIQETSAIETLGGRGKLKINLKWNTIDDVDLHVYDPDNNHIFYSSKSHTCQGVVGQLDIDANAGSPYTSVPQENIYWDAKAPIGHYIVDVNLFNNRSGAASIPFTVTVYPEKGQPKIYTDVLSTPKQTIRILEFDYSEQGISYKS